jgi:hypothetical protein
VSEKKVGTESLTSLKIQVGNDGQVHSFADNSERWLLSKPISIVDLVKKYNDLSEETEEGLTSLKIEADDDGQVLSFTDANNTWKFMNPISVVDLVKRYNEVLANVVMELNGLKDPLITNSRPRYF